MEFRRAQLIDIPQLAILFDQYRIFYRKESNIKEAQKFLSERIQQNESVIFVAEDQHQLVGFTQLYPLFSSTNMQKSWLLNDLFVHQAHRGKGISVGLINQAKQLVLTTNSYGLTLETEKTNTIGNNLYPHTGFILNDKCNFYEWRSVSFP